MSPGYEVQIRLETKKPKVSISSLKKNIPCILKALGWKKAALSIVLTDDQKIRKINQKYLRHDRATDVISFSQLEGKGLRSKDQCPFLGDIVISLETTARQAFAFGNSFDYELHFYLCHGILHLMGYDDKTNREAAIMEKKQKMILKKIGLRHSEADPKGLLCGGRRISRDPSPRSG